MRKKINLIDSTFSHLTGEPEPNKGYSVHAKESKHIEWVTDGSGEGTFFTDLRIFDAFNSDVKGPKYAWILESKAINPQLFQWLDQNIDLMVNTFDIIFIYERKYLKMHPKFKWCAAQGFWVKEPQVYPKSKMISMITSNKNFCPGHRSRLEWYESFKDQVDCYGYGINWIDYKEQGLSDYMFSIAIENCEVDGYFTEKLLDCFACGTIPVYLGDPNIGDCFNTDGIINLSEEFDVSEELYYSKMDAIKDNMERAKQYEVLEDYLYLNYLK